MSTLILLSAIPGSGKSTWAKEYQQAHPNTYIVSSDEIRSKLGADHSDTRVWKIFLEELNKHSDEDCTVIADATNLQNNYRKYYADMTPGYDKHVLVLFKIPIEICLFQNRMRDGWRVVPEEAMKSLISEWEEPTREVIDLYDEFIVIDETYISNKAKKVFADK